jgi:hypothetical protein
MKVRLRRKFFADSLNTSSPADAKSTLAAVAPKRDSVICVYSYGYMMKSLIRSDVFVIPQE